MKAASLALAFSPDSHWLVTGSDDSTARLWDLNIGELVNKACQVVGRNFTSAEWMHYFPHEEYRATCPQWPAGAGI